MKQTDTRGRQSVRTMMVGLLTILLIVALLCIVYVGQQKKTMEEENERYLREVSHHVAAMVNYRVESTFQALGTSARQWSQMEDREQGFRYLKMIAEEYGFTRIGVIGTNRHTITTDGYDTNLSDLAILRRALNGKEAAMTVMQSPLDGLESIVYMVPIWQRGQVVGALSATSYNDQMIALLGVESFGGEGYSQIIDQEGNFVVASSNKNAPQGETNFFQMLDIKCRLERGSSVTGMRANMAEGLSGVLHYESLDGKDGWTMNYSELGMEHWYLLSVVPVSAAGEKTHQFILVSVAVNGIIVGLFAALVLITAALHQRSQKELERLAFVDSVTGGMNRTSFERGSAYAIRQSPPASFAMVAMDIQRFKLINDAFGSEAGNRALAHVYKILSQHLREREMVGRVSADRFNLLMEYSDKQELFCRLEAAVKDINAFNEGAERKYFLSMPAGIYVVEDPTLDIITIQDRANVARKNNKQMRHGRLLSCVLYTDLERLRMLREKEIDDRKESALENGEFIVYLQPKIELRHQTLAGAEALIRWQDPAYGLVCPDDFIPAFEKNGFITVIDLFVFQEVCGLLRRWTDEGKQPMPISVNLSRAHLDDPEFLAPFKEVFNRHHLPHNLIEFEFTETLAYENLGGLVDAIHQIHALGFGCALDDFGSGYSSLNTLKDIPADVLKLDRAFFDGEENDDRGRSVVENVIQLARKLNMQTVSEGVESLRQVAFLKDAQCDLVQGYVFSKPLPVEEFQRVWAKSEHDGLFMEDKGESEV